MYERKSANKKLKSEKTLLIKYKKSCLMPRYAKKKSLKKCVTKLNKRMRSWTSLLSFRKSINNLS